MNLSMKIKLVGSLVMISILGGCSASTLSIKEEKSNKKFIKYDNTNHIVGNKDRAIKTLIYKRNNNGKIEKRITFYIDKLPYKMKFDLCKDQKKIQVLKSVIDMPNGKSKGIYEDEIIDCNSAIYIYESKRTNKIEGSYNLKMLNGFNVHYLKGHELLLKNETTAYVSRIVFETTSEDRMFYDTLPKSEYWYFEN